MKEAVKVTILTRRELPKVKGFDFGALPPRPRSDTQHVSVTIHQMRKPMSEFSSCLCYLPNQLSITHLKIILSAAIYQFL